VCIFSNKMSWEQHKVSFVHNDLCLTLSAKKLARYMRLVKGKNFEARKAFRSLKYPCALCTYTVGIELYSLKELTLPFVLIFTICSPLFPHILYISQPDFPHLYPCTVLLRLPYLFSLPIGWSESRDSAAPRSLADRALKVQSTKQIWPGTFSLIRIILDEQVSENHGWKGGGERKSADPAQRVSNNIQDHLSRKITLTFRGRHLQWDRFSGSAYKGRSALSTLCMNRPTSTYRRWFSRASLGGGGGGGAYI
jgi:hypothetical protein